MHSIDTQLYQYQRLYVNRNVAWIFNDQHWPIDIKHKHHTNTIYWNENYFFLLRLFSLHIERAQPWPQYTFRMKDTRVHAFVIRIVNISKLFACTFGHNPANLFAFLLASHSIWRTKQKSRSSLWMNKLNRLLQSIQTFKLYTEFQMCQQSILNCGSIKCN